jgi:hypothetical protein
MKVDDVCSLLHIYFSSVTEYTDRIKRMWIWVINPLNAELNPICHLLAVLGAHPILHVSRIRINLPETRLVSSVVYCFTSLINSWKTARNVKTQKTKLDFCLLLTLLILIGHISEIFLSKIQN